MLHLTWEPTVRYGFSSLNDYQFASHPSESTMTFVFPAPYIYLSLYPLFNGHYDEFFVINVITFVSSGFRDSLFAEYHLFI
jgi:hypothetical protein